MFAAEVQNNVCLWVLQGLPETKLSDLRVHESSEICLV
jgi:hypothetical protein